MVCGWLPEQAGLVRDAEVIQALLTEFADANPDVNAFETVLEHRGRDPHPQVAEAARRIQWAWQYELAEAAGEPLATKPRVLVVDDDPVICELVAEALKRRFEVSIATSGTESLAQARAQPPALVVLDVMMPDLDGYEVARRLRAEPATAGVRILFCTARGGLDARVLGREVGGDGYVVKPFEWHRLAAQAATMVGLDPLGA
jgi:CheY-like chemotaxis protein